MKSYILIWLTTLLIQQDDFVIKKKSVGPLKIGSYVEEIYRYFDKDKETKLIDSYYETAFSPGMQVTREGEVLFVANINCKTISSFEIYSPRYKTSFGICVGSNFGQLKKVKQNVTLKTNEGNLSAAIKELEMSILFENDKRIQSLDFNKATLKDIPDDVKITSIIVY
ncbi:MAG: hypothetical protein HYR67_07715 [Bacteroidetes bacterium]|nr:hypothetical protein [Bacteroidota bacterium]